TRCNGRCKDKCVVIDYPKGTWYSVQNEETSRAIVQDTAEESSIIYSVEHGERIRHENRIKGIDKYKKGRGPLKKAVLFVGHGSRLEAGNEEVRQFVEQTKTYIDPALLVETCFLEFASPNIEDGIQLCVERGADEVHVITIILLYVEHSKILIPADIEHARDQFPDFFFTYSQTIGIYVEIFQILKTRLTEVGFNPDEKHDETATLLIARGG